MLEDSLTRFVLSLVFLVFLVAFSLTVHEEPQVKWRLPRYCSKGCRMYGVPNSSYKLYLYECHYNGEGLLMTVSENGEMLCRINPQGTFVVQELEGNYSTYSTDDF